MGLRVNTNVASMTAQRNLQQVTSRLGGNFSRLSSGLRIASASDDAAGLGISERMRSQIRSYGVAARNTQDGISMAQTAEGALNEVSNMLGRMRELSMQAANGTMSVADRTTVDNEYQSLLTEVNRVATDTDFNGISLLDNATANAIQVGLDTGETIAVDGQDVSALTTAGTAILTAATASTALGLIDADIDTVNNARGALGATQNRLQSALSSILNVKENISAAESRIRDVDVAFETADLTRNSILQQAATSVLAQANVQPQLALSLLG
jgi:flagellin